MYYFLIYLQLLPTEYGISPTKCNLLAISSINSWRLISRPAWLHPTTPLSHCISHIMFKRQQQLNKMWQCLLGKAALLFKKEFNCYLSQFNFSGLVCIYRLGFINIYKNTVVSSLFHYSTLTAVNDFYKGYLQSFFFFLGSWVVWFYTHRYDFYINILFF